MPKLSVILPVYNERPKFMENAIQSILNQTYRDFEFLIIDDASESYVGEIINSYKDERIVYVRLEQNSKICAALNQGIEQSLGEYIAIMHSDDFSIRSRLEKQISVLESNVNIGLVNSYSLIKSGNKSQLNRPFLDQNFEKLYLKYVGNNIIHPNVMIRKSVLQENGISYNEQFVYAEDYRMWIDIMPFCDFCPIPEVLTIYNLNVNPNRQNKEYMEKCRKVILLENYMNLLNSYSDKFNSLIAMVWTKGKIKYLDYMNMKKDIIPQILDKVKSDLSAKQFLEFKNYLSNTIEDFNRFKKDNDDIRTFL